MNTYQFPISTHMHIKIRDYAIITRINQNPNGFNNNHNINKHKYRFTIFPKWGLHIRENKKYKDKSLKETTLEEIPPSSP